MMATDATIHQAEKLSNSLPELFIQAEQLANSLYMGAHGRRQAGTGEQFWQFKAFQSGEAGSTIDWRQSAKKDKLHIREKEWEAAQKIMILPLITPSLFYHSDPHQSSKYERLILMTLAICFLLSKAGELFTIYDSGLPFAFSRDHIYSLGENLINNKSARKRQQNNKNLRYFSIVLGDFLDPIQETHKTLLQQIPSSKSGMAIQILDEAEVTFPFHGAVCFQSPDKTSKKATESANNLTFSKAETVREQYLTAFKEHQDLLYKCLIHMGLTPIQHITSAQASQPLIEILDRLKTRRL